jgi:hypothetical protein
MFGDATVSIVGVARSTVAMLVPRADALSATIVHREIEDLSGWSPAPLGSGQHWASGERRSEIDLADGSDIRQHDVCARGLWRESNSAKCRVDQGDRESHPGTS